MVSEVQKINNSEVLVIGDLHGHNDHVRISVIELFFNYLFLLKEFITSKYVIFLGDLYHEDLPGGDIIYFIMSKFFSEFRSKKIIIIQGNHDYSRTEGSAIKPLKIFNNITIINKPTVLELESSKCLFLPYLYPNTIKKNSKEYYSNMKTEYSNPENFPDKDFDFIFGHIADETAGNLLQEVDISFLKGKRILGHIHKQISKNYLGTPFITRRDEKDKESYVGLINLDNKEFNRITLPCFINYYKIQYNLKKLPNFNSNIKIIDIEKVPSNDLGRDYFNKTFNSTDFILGKMEKETFSELSQSVSSNSLSIKELIIEFCKNNKIIKEVKEKMLEVQKKQYI